MTAMPLLKNTLSQQLETLFEGKPSSPAQAASDWASAYVSYASSAMSSVGSLPVTATASQSMLVSAFTAAFSTQTSSGAAAAMAQGVIAFWTAMVWVGPTSVGATVFPGNLALSAQLAQIFGGTSEQSHKDKAGVLADAFDAGAKLVMVNDVLPPPATPVVGPIS
jgi:hypothetical protein